MAVRWYIDRASKEIEQFDITVTHVGIYRYIIYARESCALSFILREVQEKRLDCQPTGSYVGFEQVGAALTRHERKCLAHEPSGADLQGHGLCERQRRQHAG